jgi:dipeptide/tripeptide permease
METKRKAKGSWGVRFFIVVMGIILGFLWFWLLSFIEQDIAGDNPPGVRQ